MYVPSDATVEQKSAKNAAAAAWLSSLSASLRFSRNTSLTLKSVTQVQVVQSESNTKIQTYSAAFLAEV